MKDIQQSLHKKLSRYEKDKFNKILSDLIKVQNFIKSNDIFICKKWDCKAESFYNQAGEGIMPITKDVGSDLCYLDNVIQSLEYILPS